MFTVDFHIHSNYSRATNRECVPEMLELWARRKWLDLIGAGDFTHLAWRAELEEKPAPAEEGLYTLKDDFRREDGIAGSGRRPRFLVFGGISSIYKRDGKERKAPAPTEIRPAKPSAKPKKEDLRAADQDAPAPRDGTIPLKNRGGRDPAEERRLLYAGMTRARDELVPLTFVRKGPLSGGKGRPNPSRSAFSDGASPFHPVLICLSIKFKVSGYGKGSVPPSDDLCLSQSNAGEMEIRMERKTVD